MPTRPLIVTPESFIPDGAMASVGFDPEPEAGDEESGGFGLHDDERIVADTMPPARRAAYVAGRRALRAALHRIAPGNANVPLLSTRRGAPQLPAGLTGSISHKRARAIALAAPTAGSLVGLDLEERPVVADLERPSIARRILTGREQEAIASLDALSHREATIVHFALKEAVYKAIDPYVERYVRFTEVELDVHSDGRATVRLLLPELATREVQVEAQWRVDERWIIAMARSARG